MLKLFRIVSLQLAEMTCCDEKHSIILAVILTSRISTLVLLGLVTDEVNLGLAGLSGSGGGDVDFGGFFGPLDQNVDKGLLFVLSVLGNDGGGGGGWGRGLDEDDFVVFLGSGGRELRARWPEAFGFWGRNVDVDVLLDGSGLRESAGEASS